MNKHISTYVLNSVDFNTSSNILDDKEKQLNTHKLFSESLGRMEQN